MFALRLCFATLLFIGSAFSQRWTPSDELGFFEHGLMFQRQVHDSFWIAWEINESNNTFFLAMAANSSGWIGFGPTETGSMIGGNPCVVREQPVGSGNFSAFAYHSESMSEPELNQDQNCRLLDFNLLNGEVYAKIQRPIIGCRPEDQDISTEWVMRWIGAFGSSQDFYYHGTVNRFTVEMDPRFGIVDFPPPPPYALSFDAVLGEPWELPSDDRDVYMCRAMQLPQDQRYHVLQVDPVYYDIAPATYHHVIMFECPNGIPDGWEDMKMKPCPFVGGIFGCSRFWMGWAIGQGPVRFNEMHPPLAMGAGEGAVRTILLETHIDNPSYSAGIIDGGWGFKIWYTDRLMDEESAVMGFYAFIPMIGIPPQQSAYAIEGYCASGCTAPLPQSGIYIYAVAPHMHSAGKAAWVTHVRNGVEIGEIFRMNAWDANWQGPRFRSEDKAVHFLPGDNLVGTCVYDTTDRNVRTWFGEGFSDEMCMFYINYYPRTDLVACVEVARGEELPREDLPILSFCSWNPWIATDIRDFDPLEPPPNNCQPLKNGFRGNVQFAIAE